MILAAILVFLSYLNPEPPQSVKAYDVPDDIGGTVIVEWTRSLSDSSGGENNVWGYRVFRIQPQSLDTHFLGFCDRWSDLTLKDTTAVNGTVYVYGVQTKSATGLSEMAFSNPVKSSKSIFRVDRIAVAVAVLLGVGIFLFSKEKTLDFFKGKSVDGSILWSVEKGKPVMVIISYEDTSSRKGVMRTLTDLKRIAGKVLCAKGEIKVLAPGYLQEAVQGIFMDILMKEGRLDEFNPLWIRRTWSGGVSYSDEACRLIEIWKPGVVLVTGEPGIWTFQPLKTALQKGAEIAGIRAGIDYLPAVVSAGVALEKISGPFSEVLDPRPVVKRYLQLTVFVILIAVFHILLCFVLMGTNWLYPTLGLREAFRGFLLYP
ncbi:hypothetical protein JXA84_04715 [candidate division WOR-3 bacterium]|nr:hypothetical protein [candidate division WOR-3 bacterium]